jgi:hypothetical protein
VSRDDHNQYPFRLSQESVGRGRGLPLLFLLIIVRSDGDSGGAPWGTTLIPVPHL